MYELQVCMCSKTKTTNGIPVKSCIKQYPFDGKISVFKFHIAFYLTFKQQQKIPPLNWKYTIDL